MAKGWRSPWDSMASFLGGTMDGKGLEASVDLAAIDASSCWERPNLQDQCVSSAGMLPVAAGVHPRDEAAEA